MTTTVALLIWLAVLLIGLAHGAVMLWGDHKRNRSDDAGKARKEKA